MHNGESLLSQSSRVIWIYLTSRHRDDIKGVNVYVSFTGTFSASDIIADLTAWSAAGDPIRQLGQGLNIHKGFFKYMSEISEQFVSGLYGILKKHRNVEAISVTGHSLGGALSTIAAYHIKKVILPNLDASEEQPFYNNINVECVTFGSPRVFDGPSAQKVEEVVGKGNIVRVWNQYDPISAVPMGFLNSKHVGVDIMLGDTLFHDWYMQFIGALPHHSVNRYFNLVSPQYSEISAQITFFKDILKVLNDKKTQSPEEWGKIVKSFNSLVDRCAFENDASGFGAKNADSAKQMVVVCEHELADELDDLKQALGTENARKFRVKEPKKMTQTEVKSNQGYFSWLFGSGKSNGNEMAAVVVPENQKSAVTDDSPVIISDEEFHIIN